MCYIYLISVSSVDELLSLSRLLVVSSLLLVRLVLRGHVVSHVVADLWELPSDGGLVSPLIQFLVNEALSVLDGILAIESTLHLNWEGKSAVVKVQDGKTTWKWSRWL